MSGRPSKQAPPKQQQEPQKPQTPYRLMYYIRIVFAIIAGILTGALDLTSYNGIAFGILIFILTYVLFRYGIRSISQNVLNSNKYITTAIFSYFMLWFMIWVVTINLMYPGPLLP